MIVGRIVITSSTKYKISTALTIFTPKHSTHIILIRLLYKK